VLTFGVLEAVIEKQVPESLLVKRDETSGNLLITTDNLAGIIRDFVERIVMCREQEQEPWLERIHANLRKAQSLMMVGLKTQFRIFGPLGEDVGATVCFCALVGEALVNAKMRFPLRMQKLELGYDWSMVWVPPFREMLVKEMNEDGWCPFTAEYLISACS